MLLAAAALLTLYMTSLRQGYEALLALLDLVSRRLALPGSRWGLIEAERVLAAVRVVLS